MPFDKTKQGGGALYKNTNKVRDTYPDYTGFIEITPEFAEVIKQHAGKRFQLAAWLKTNDRGTFMSLQLKEPWEKQGQGGGGNGPRRVLPDDEIPFDWRRYS